MIGKDCPDNKNLTGLLVPSSSRNLNFYLFRDPLIIWPNSDDPCVWWQFIDSKSGVQSLEAVRGRARSLTCKISPPNRERRSFPVSKLLAASLAKFRLWKTESLESRNPSEYDFEAVQEGRRRSMAYFFKGAHTHLKKNTEMENCYVERDWEL